MRCQARYGTGEIVTGSIPACNASPRATVEPSGDDATQRTGEKGDEDPLAVLLRAHSAGGALASGALNTTVPYGAALPPERPHPSLRTTPNSARRRGALEGRQFFPCRPSYVCGRHAMDDRREKGPRTRPKAKVSESGCEPAGIARRRAWLRRSAVRRRQPAACVRTRPLPRVVKSAQWSVEDLYSNRRDRDASPLIRKRFVAAACVLLGFGPDAQATEGVAVNHLRVLAVATLTILIGAASKAFAGTSAISLPEPSTLAVLAAGVGAVAILKFWKRK